MNHCRIHGYGFVGWSFWWVRWVFLGLPKCFLGVASMGLATGAADAHSWTVPSTRNHHCAGGRRFPNPNIPCISPSNFDSSTCRPPQTSIWVLADLLNFYSSTCRPPKLRFEHLQTSEALLLFFFRDFSIMGGQTVPLKSENFKAIFRYLPGTYTQKYPGFGRFRTFGIFFSWFFFYFFFRFFQTFAKKHKIPIKNNTKS